MAQQPLASVTLRPILAWRPEFVATFGSAAPMAAVLLLTSLLAPALGMGLPPSLRSAASSPFPLLHGPRAGHNAAGPKGSGSPAYPQGKGISYWGGPVMNKPIKVYFLWLGYISKSRKNYVKNFINSLSPSNDSRNTVQDWWAIATLYTDSQGNNVSSHVSVGGEIDILDFNNVAQLNYDLGLPYDNFTEWQLSDLRSSAAVGGVFGVAETALFQGLLPYDPNGFYVVFSNESVWQGDYDWGFCNIYCGWHLDAYVQSPAGKVTLKYAWMGISGNQHGGGCGCVIPYDPYLDVVAPLGNDAAIATVVTVLAHELAEAATDPVPYSGWVQNGTLAENGDLCAWTFGRTHVSSSNVAYNLVGLGGAQYIIQRLWNPVLGNCTLSPFA